MEGAHPDALLAQLCEELPDLAEVGEQAGRFMFNPAAQRSTANPAPSGGGMQNTNVNVSLPAGLPAAGVQDSTLTIPSTTSRTWLKHLVCRPVP